MSEAQEPRHKLREITDARTMRALAHPTRLDLLELLRREGELTATRAADLLGESPGNMSWHLQTLAKYGFVEETGEGRGRSRPWRIASESNRFRTDPSAPGAAAAGAVLASQVLERSVQREREWMASRHSFSVDWQNSSFLNTSSAYLTPDELLTLSDELARIFSRYNDRDDRSQRPEGALPVNLTAFGHPVPPTESGN
jgi:DNA-binding transcriptional ArsR family regulator